ncbi:Flp pilus assembly protein TadD, contains TPR repeats [Paraburkholderia sabiae]|uniref:tetratricopeptide repeat-containing glycosyltransferase family protein n=1 Tax=Paraburkholderia sabiae TaxID=273251 RepID=UPI001CAF9BC2|nr:tetratricopeptide repeat-containing glycosyltransferase family protein [Paraburkholderia sabiae]CAG9188882.1 Flp pilus assembly protein TadD, contains TPR repeats [Paraburkholderia sabiae]
MSVFDTALAAHRAGRLNDAERDYCALLQQEPHHADALHLLGLLHSDRGAMADAEALILQALNVDENPIYLNNLANLLTDQDRANEAEALLRRAVELAPGYVDAHYNLGTMFMETGRTDEAEVAFRCALDYDSQFVPALINLGGVLIKAQRFAEAEAYSRKAIDLDATRPIAHHNLGMILVLTRRLLQAEVALRRAVELAPDYSDAWLHLGNALELANRDAEAEAAYRRAIELAPEPANACHSLGLLLLSNGRYAEGWQYCESRYLSSRRFGTSLLPSVDYPQWRGESLQDKSLVIVHEQGFGDSIQFVRYAPLLKALGLRRLTIVCPAVLKPLLETVDGVDDVVSELVASKPAHDFWAFTMSLPLRFNTTAGTIPSHLPYLHALPERIAKWQQRLPVHGLKVGLVWKGNPEHSRDTTRSLPGLATLAPLWSVPDVSFISLQKGQGESEAALATGSLRVTHLGGAIDDFADSAAIVTQLDLVITIDTSMAHLAGALGKTCWVMLPMFSTDWRWLRERTDSPWYPGVMQLFRQTRLDDWDETVSRMAAALKVWTKTLDDARDQAR